MNKFFPLFFSVVTTLSVGAEPPAVPEEADTIRESAPTTVPENLDKILEAEIAARVKNDRAAEVQAAKDRGETAPPPAPAYFFVPFAYQSRKNPASDSHTFASFVAVETNGKQHWATISWLPADFNEPLPESTPEAPLKKGICVGFRDLLTAAAREVLGNPCEPVPAKNYQDLRTSLAWAREYNRQLAIWGPYRVKEELYALGMERVRQLAEGRLLYLADDRKTRSPRETTAMNCMSAVGDLPGTFDRGRNIAPYGIWGIKGTQNVLAHYLANLSGGFLDPIRPKEYRLYAGDSRAP